MEPFKIENYERVHGSGTFIPFRHLSEVEAERLYESLRKVQNLPDEISLRLMPRAIRDMTKVVEGVDAAIDGFDLKQVLNNLGFDITGTIYLIWSGYDIDELKTRDMITNFSDIWYPSSDDLNVVDSRMQWLLDIEHSGVVRALGLMDH